MINLKGLPCPPLATPPSCRRWLRVEQVWRTNPLKIPCGHVPKPNQFFSLFSNLSPRSPCSSPSSSSCCWRNIFGFMWIRVIYSNRFRFRFRFRFGVAPPPLPPPSKHIAAKWPLRALPCPLPSSLAGLAIIQNQSLWFWQLANFSLLYHINFMSVVFAALHKDRRPTELTPPRTLPRLYLLLAAAL